MKTNPKFGCSASLIAFFIVVITMFAQHGRAANYADAVLADGPIAYWRFNDAIPTAVNSGSLGAAAKGTYTGDAKPGAEAPAPPAFPGFEANNTAAQFDGAGDYVGSAVGLM